MATTKICPSCAKDIPGEARFCPQCGTPQAFNCAACGHANAAGSRFCAQCGAKLGEAAAAATAAPAAAATPAPPPSVARAAAAAERRQLTVMFCDLVGSTALSTQLDPEDLGEVIAAYHKCAADVVSRFGGYVAKYMGDDVLVYFGYPEAHEADAENALRAGLALVDAIARLFKEGRHQVRIGIATGLVVVGELVGAGEAQERNVVGETPNLAARLQSAAAPNTVVIAATTRRLAGDLFEYEAIEPTQLKGFQELVSAWRVVRERTIASRFEALRAASRTPLIGREEEMELLLRRWQRIKDGEGRVVLLAGEPGIGKSRLTAALEDHLKQEAHVCLRYFCQPHQQGSALQPIMGQLAHAARFSPDDTPAEKRTKFEAMLTPEAGIAAADVGLFFELMGLAEARASDAADMDPQRKRRRLLGALIEQLADLARRGPVLILFEDVHWADPTSVELLTLVIERLQSLPILLVVTFRPDYQPPWTGQPHVTMLALNRLGRREREKLVEHITGGKSLPPELLDQIVDRTDGIPLFVEELTKAVLESEQLHEESDRYVLERPMQQLAIPTTLQDSLMARVDRLGSAREVLQIGAAIGREFSYEVLAAVAGLADAVLQDALIRLTEAEMLFLRGTPPNAVYSFKHALVQDTAYSPMLRARRQQLHSAIALVLEKRSPEVVNATPEVIAQQFEWAGQNEKAVEYWRRAGDRHLRRFAMKESIAHYSNALRLVAALPETPQRDGLELGICLGLGMAQQIGIGPTSKEAAACYVRALTLSRALPNREREQFLATWGVWFYNTMTGLTAESRVLADDLVAIARAMDDSDLLVEAYHARVPGLIRIPDFPALKESALEVIRLYDRERNRDHAYYFGGHDSRVCARSFYAVSLWGLGFPDQAQQMAWQCIEDARVLGHTFSLAHGLNMGGLTHLLLKDVDACRAITDELYPLAERNKFPWPLTYARFQRGWLKSQEGDRDAGIEQMLKAANEAPAAVLQPIVLTLIAEQQMLAKRFDDAVGTLDRATNEMNTQGNRFYEAEIMRLRGEVSLAQSPDNATEAETAFRQALALAIRHCCRPLELRAVTSLARLLGKSGRREEARDVLAPIYGAFAEGFDRPDLQTAKTLLDELA
ncbi:MAG TPA: AAA family ATPase [Xanthobacteraceae bacterium]|nr:AAA family ATPase [Xanthobacteraceae bacterium]